MAYQSKDGKRQFTNRPAARQHDARIDQLVADHKAKSDRGSSNDPHESHERALIGEMAGMHGMTVTCPQCGHSFEPPDDSDHADEPPAETGSHGFNA
jgi:hypothetical protein